MISQFKSNSKLDSDTGIKSSSIWSNSDLSPDNTAIPEDTETSFQPNTAKKRGNLSVIQSFSQPLAFTIETKKTSGGIFSAGNPSTLFAIRCWNIDIIRELANQGEVKRRSEDTEFEIWVGGGTMSFSPGDREEIASRLKDSM